MSQQQQSLEPVSESKDNEKNQIDPTLDVTSAHFDPLKALSTKSIIIPCPTATKFDNVSQFESHMKKLQAVNVKIEKIQTTPKSKIKIGRDVTTTPSTSGRRFLPHQGLIQGRRKAKNDKTLIKAMERREGPLGVLYKYVKEKTRVKILIRDTHGIRGYITGVIVLFDKHWNMALTDVQECYKRRKYDFSCSTLRKGEAQDCSDRLKELGIQIPKLEIKSLSRKHIECKRNISQLVVRGEQIALVTLDKT